MNIGVEIWKDIEGFEGRYQISNYGNVKSIIRKKHRILSPSIKHNGYLGVNLYDENKKMWNKQIHRLVAIAFIPNPDNLPQVNHIDENKENNHADNLEWCTQNQNIHHGTLYQRVRETRISEQLKNAPIPIIQCDLDGNPIREFSSITEASKILGINKGNIQRACVNFPYRTSRGFKWKFK